MLQTKLPYLLKKTLVEVELAALKLRLGKGLAEGVQCSLFKVQQNPMWNISGKEMLG